MAPSDKSFSGSIPTIYDLYMVPLMFQPMAEIIAARVAARYPRQVLETAAGTGVVTAELLRRLPRGTLITATDLSQAMLDIAAVRLPGGEVRIGSCDAMRLPFPARSYDAVVCQFGAMFFPDKAVAFREARRVLREGGCFYFSVWDSLAANPLAAALERVLGRLLPGDPPNFFSRVPYAYHDVRRVAADLSAAGFTDIRSGTITLPSTAPSPRHVAVAICQGTPFQAEIDQRAPGRIEEITSKVAAAIADEFGSGKIESTMQAIVFEAQG